MDSDSHALAWEDPSPLLITFHRTARVGDHEDPSRQTVATAVEASPPCKLTRWPPDGDEYTYLLALDCPADRALPELDAFGICASAGGATGAGVKLEVKVEGENVAFPPLSRWEEPPASTTRPQDYFFLSGSESEANREWIHGIAVKEEPRLVRQFVVRNDGTGASIQQQVTGATVPEKMGVVEIEVTFASRSSESTSGSSSPDIVVLSSKATGDPRRSGRNQATDTATIDVDSPFAPRDYSLPMTPPDPSPPPGSPPYSTTPAGAQSPQAASSPAASISSSPGRTRPVFPAPPAETAPSPTASLEQPDLCPPPAPPAPVNDLELDAPVASGLQPSLPPELLFGEAGSTRPVMGETRLGRLTAGPVKKNTAYGSPLDLDLEFAALVGSGLSSSGFDPKIVIEEPHFYRRTSISDTWMTERLAEDPLATRKLEILPGGLIAQPLTKDPGTHKWESQPKSGLTVRIVNFEQFRGITGLEPPAPPQPPKGARLPRRDRRNPDGTDSMLASNAEHQFNSQVPGDDFTMSSAPSSGGESTFPGRGGTKKPSRASSHALQLPTTNLVAIHSIPEAPRRKRPTSPPPDASPSNDVSSAANNDTAGHAVSTEESSGGSAPKHPASEGSRGKRKASGGEKGQGGNGEAEAKSGSCNCCTCM